MGRQRCSRTSCTCCVSTGGSSPREYAARQGYAAEMAAWGANAADADVGEASLDAAMAPNAVADDVLVVTSEQRLIRRSTTGRRAHSSLGRGSM